MISREQQIAHVKTNQALFDRLQGQPTDVDAYFSDYSHYPDLYERLCDDMGIAPLRDTTPLTPAGDLFSRITNPALREALRYRVERQAMSNPKGWHRVGIALRDAYSAGAIDCTDAQYSEARAVLAILTVVE